MVRRYGLHVLMLLAVGLLSGFAWLTQNPDTPWLETAREWPLVGELAARFQEAYLGPQGGGGGARLAAGEATGAGADPETPDRRPTAPSRRSAGGAPRVRDQAGRPGPAPEEPIHLPPSAYPPAREPGASGPPTAPAAPAPRPAPAPVRRPRISYLAEEWVWFLPGQRIRAAALPEAPVEEHLAALAYLPVLRRNGGWAEVVHGGETGWIDTTWEPPHRRRGARRGLLRHRYEPVQGSDYWRLKEARKLLGIDRSSVKLGAYDVYTDVEDTDLLAFLDGAAVAAEEAYFARYARLPSGDPLRSVVLFARVADYHRFSESVDIASDRHVGYAGRGILTFYAEDRSNQELARTLVHEIAHLLNDRALARELPPWLEEGMATDLGSVWVESSRLVEPPRGAGSGESLEIQGPEARFLLLGELLAARRLPTVGALLRLDREAFYQAATMTWAYAHSMAFIRYLLDGEDGRHAEAFREFLGQIAAGRRADLLKLLGTDLEELDRGFRVWLRTEARRHRQRLEQRVSTEAKIR